MKILGLPTAAAVFLTTLYTPVSSAAEEAILTVGRTTGEILIDGQLSDAGWADVDAIETWYETRPGDNVEPKVKNVGYLAYDDKFFYAAFRFSDPEPNKIRSPLANRDRVPSYTDYGGVMIDANNDGKTAQMFLANARGIQYDAINSDAAGEDSSPDFFWDSAARITEEGWILEMRIPFSSLRYTESNPEQWGIMLYRNRPREFRYQMFSSRLPRESTCFICNVKPLKVVFEAGQEDHRHVGGARNRRHLAAELEAVAVGGVLAVEVHIEDCELGHFAHQEGAARSGAIGVGHHREPTPAQAALEQRSLIGVVFNDGHAIGHCPKTNGPSGALDRISIAAPAPLHRGRRCSPATNPRRWPWDRDSERCLR